MSIIQDILTYEFLRNAFIAGILVSVLTSLFSTVVVLRKIEFIGDGAAHAAFGGLALGFLIGAGSEIMAMITAIIFALTISYFSKRKKISENSMIGMLLPLSMAIGVILLSFVRGYTPDVMGYLFGNILLVGKSDIWLLLGFTLTAVFFFYLFRREILYYSYDENMAKHCGVNIDFIHYAILIGLSLSIVASVKIAGIILVTAFIVTPAVTAKLIVKTYRGMVLFSLLFSALAMVSGLGISYLFDLPPGPVVVLILFLEFLLTYVVIMKTRNE